MHRHRPHPVTPVTVFPETMFKTGKRRGSYNCGRCGQPKKGHVCHLPPPPSLLDNNNINNINLNNINNFKKIDEFEKTVTTPEALSTHFNGLGRLDIEKDSGPDAETGSWVVGSGHRRRAPEADSTRLNGLGRFNIEKDSGPDAETGSWVVGSGQRRRVLTFDDGGVDQLTDLDHLNGLGRFDIEKDSDPDAESGSWVDGSGQRRQVLTFDDGGVDELTDLHRLNGLGRFNIEKDSDPDAESGSWFDGSGQGRRVLSFDNVGVDELTDSDDVDEFRTGSGELSVGCLWEVLKRLPPTALLSAGKVCTRWRDVSKRLWRGAEELRVKVPVGMNVGCVGSVLQKCPELVRLSLTMQSDMDSTMLACIAFACPNLESLEIVTCEGSFNRITGDELGRFVADKRCLTTLKMEGCSNLRAFILSSNTLSTLWLSDLHSLSKMVFNLPNLNEISLDFSRQENDCTDLTSMMDGLGRSCPKLKNIHIASLRLSHSVVLSLTAAHLRVLRKLSLVLGSEITDASVVAISKCYSNLELLDLSGSSISDSGLGMICNVFPETLTRLLVALCPNITSSGIQFATAQLPLLELMDCGMTICEPDAEYSTSVENSDTMLHTSPNRKLHLTCHKLFIKHDRLKKLSLWGCSSLDSLYLCCPSLIDLNLNSCKYLIPEKIVLQCPKLESVHAIGCQDVLIQAVQTQLSSDYAPLENRYSCKRMADGSKRVRIPFSFNQQLPDYDKTSWSVRKRRCTVQVK